MASRLGLSSRVTTSDPGLRGIGREVCEEGDKNTEGEGGGSYLTCDSKRWAA